MVTVDPAQPIMCTLRSGAIVELRAIEPTDGDALANFHESNSDRTIYLRFFGAHPHLTAAEVHRFTNVDHSDREAFVAVMDERIVGVARWDRIDETSAEVAFVVNDDFQHQGLGSVLFSMLADKAQRHGIHEFVAEILPQNRAMMRLFEVFGTSYNKQSDDGIVRMSVQLTPVNLQGIAADE